MKNDISEKYSRFQKLETHFLKNYSGFLQVRNVISEKYNHFQK
ncbi:hypothetical protein [Capnocytophaga canimorsus]|nr:hypothetical protein [Capnocytophaga canimorsus]